MLQSFILQENSRRSSYASVIHPPTRKFEAKLLFFCHTPPYEKIRGEAHRLQVWENFCQPSHTENIRGEAPIKKETLDSAIPKLCTYDKPMQHFLERCNCLRRCRCQ